MMSEVPMEANIAHVSVSAGPDQMYDHNAKIKAGEAENSLISLPGQVFYRCKRGGMTCPTF
jgi:hypothetical protein